MHFQQLLQFKFDATESSHGDWRVVWSKSLLRPLHCGSDLLEPIPIWLISAVPLDHSELISGIEDLGNTATQIDCFHQTVLEAEFSKASPEEIFTLAWIRSKVDLCKWEAAINSIPKSIPALHIIVGENIIEISSKFPYCVVNFGFNQKLAFREILNGLSYFTRPFTPACVDINDLRDVLGSGLNPSEIVHCEPGLLVTSHSKRSTRLKGASFGRATSLNGFLNQKNEAQRIAPAVDEWVHAIAIS